MVPNQDTQISAFLARTTDAPATDDDAKSPQVVFRTAMELTRDQEERLVNQFFQRKQELEQEIGRQQVKNNGWWRNVVWDGDMEQMTWLGKRDLMEMVYHQNLDWRRAVMGGIFAQGQNVHMPFCRRIVQQMISRAINFFFSTDPYFSVNPMPAPGVDTTKAEQADSFAKYKFQRAGVKDALQKAVEKAFIRGEAVMKTRHWTDAVRYQTFANVAVAVRKPVQQPVISGQPVISNDPENQEPGPQSLNTGATGAPITDNSQPTGGEAPPITDYSGSPPLIAHDGDYIYDTDRWVSRPQLTAEEQQAVEQAQREGQPVDLSQFPTVMTLERDPATSLPAEPLQFERRKVTRVTTRYDGPEASNVYPADFLAPLNCPDLQTADLVAHVYDIPAMELVQMYITRLKAMDQYDPNEFPRLLELLRTAPSDVHAASETAATAPRAELHETSATAPTQATKSDPALNIAEAYLTYDVDGDGTYEEVFLMIDLKTRRPIIYDHLPNVFPNAKRPFHVVVINPVEGRWHGIGMMEVFWELQKFVDLSVNRWDMSMSQSGAVTFWHPELTVEGSANPALRLNTGETYRKRDPKTESQHIVERVWLHEFKGANLEHLVQFCAQMMTNMSGVANINDAAMAGLNTSKLATGVRNLDKSGQEQFAPLLSHLEPGITSVLEALLYLTLWHMDDVELYHVLEGDAVKPLQIQAIDVQHLQYEVSLELSRYKNEQVVAEAQAARQCACTFAALPFVLQQRLAPLFRQELRAYQIQDIDSIIIPTDPSSYGAPGQVPGAQPVDNAAPPAQPAPQDANLT